MSNDMNIDAVIERIAAVATDGWFTEDVAVPRLAIPDLVRRAVRAGYEAGRASKEADRG